MNKLMQSTKHTIPELDHAEFDEIIE